MRVCSSPGCPVLLPQSGRCIEHARQADRARGTRQQRGYTREHDQRRADWSQLVAAGTVDCWRCRGRIHPTEPWHLGHDDHDRTIWRGPEHVKCNLAAAGRASHTT